MASEMTRHAEAIADKLDTMYVGELREYFREHELDVEYTVTFMGSDLIVVGAQIWITIGGPTVWVDTREGTVHANHGDDKGTAWLKTTTAATIHRIYEECFYESL